MKTKRFKKFFEDTKGNVAIAFAISSVALFGVAGAAIDYSRASGMSSAVQAAADSAALAAAVSGLSDQERIELAKKSAEQNLQGKVFSTRPEINVDLSDPSKVVVDISTNVKPMLVSMIGIRNISVNANSVAGLLKGGAEVALVLDISGSMLASMGGQSRIDALKESAKNLVSLLEKSQGAKVGVVPFTMNVNIGKDNAKYVIGKKHKLFSGTKWAGCVFERAAPYHVTDDYNGSKDGAKGKWHAMAWPPMPNENSQCINQSDGTNKGYATIDENASGVYNSQTKGPNFNCVRHSVMPLSKNMSDVRDKIDSLTSVGNQGTIIGPGVTWGMRMLSPAEPFSEGSDYDSGKKKIIIVLTDGEQTTEAEFYGDTCHQEKNSKKKFKFDPAKFKLGGDILKKTGPDDMLSPYGFIKDSDPLNSNPNSWDDVKDDLEKISLAACTAAKEKPANGEAIEIYSIAVSTAAGPGTKVYDLLKSCATSTDKFFYAADSAGLDNAFKEIAKGILQVRIVK